MVDLSISEYKRRYTTELSRLLFVHLPPRNGRCYGLTGNFLPVIVKVNSVRKFGKLKGWYYTFYSVTNKFAKLSERMDIFPLDEHMLMRLLYRYWTCSGDIVDLCTIVSNIVSDVDTNNTDSRNSREHVYITVLDIVSCNIYLFYVNEKRSEMLRSVCSYGSVRVMFKRFLFKRFGITILNYVTDDGRVIEVLAR